METIKTQIIEYIDQYILPIYSEKIKYKREHIDYVLRRSLFFANQIKSDDNNQSINIEMVYVIAAYHDIGEVDNRKTHELVGAKMLREDKFLQDNFTAEQIEVMAQAVEDHRASGKNEPRSIYGRIVATADRLTNIDELMVLMYGYRTRYETKISDIIEDAYAHLRDKFGEHGYSHRKLYFNDPEYDKFKSEAIILSKNKNAFVKRFSDANGIKF